MVSFQHSAVQFNVVYVNCDIVVKTFGGVVGWGGWLVVESENNTNSVQFQVKLTTRTKLGNLSILPFVYLKIVQGKKFCHSSAKWQDKVKSFLLLYL
jgi:hypothetical protein